MVITERLATLRREIAQHGMNGYVVVTDDFHGSEYVGDFFKARAYLSGFTGSAGIRAFCCRCCALRTGKRSCGRRVCCFPLGERRPFPPKRRPWQRFCLERAAAPNWT